MWRPWLLGQDAEEENVNTTVSASNMVSKEDHQYRAKIQTDPLGKNIITHI